MADKEVAFLHAMIQQAVREEIPHELAWLQGYDLPFSRLNSELVLPQNQLSALIRMVYSNRGKLSANRRKQYFHYPDQVLDRIEEVVREAFAGQSGESPLSKN